MVKQPLQGQDLDNLKLAEELRNVADKIEEKGIQNINIEHNVGEEKLTTEKIEITHIPEEPIDTKQILNYRNTDTNKNTESYKIDQYEILNLYKEQLDGFEEIDFAQTTKLKFSDYDSYKTVRKYLTTLEKEDILTVENERGNSLTNVYYIKINWNGWIWRDLKKHYKSDPDG